MKSINLLGMPLDEYVVMHLREIAAALLLVVILLCALPFVELPGATTLTGRVTSQGKPVVFGTVTVITSDQRAHSVPIQPDGTYARARTTVECLSGRTAWRRPSIAGGLSRNGRSRGPTKDHPAQDGARLLQHIHLADTSRAGGKGVPRGPVKVAVSSPNPQPVVERQAVETGAVGSDTRSQSARPKSASGGSMSGQPAAGSGQAKTVEGVSIAATNERGPASPDPGRSDAAQRGWFRIPGRYANPATSGIGTDVGRGRTILNLSLD